MERIVFAKVEVLPFCYPGHIYFSGLLVPLPNGLDLVITLIQAVKQDVPALSAIIRPYAKNVLDLIESKYNKLAYNIYMTVKILRTYFEDL